ncbi:lasso peptide biosynthesis B2 protein [Paenibacillus thailandensis]|uniref:Lasso peptide biosynthesis B2 protein n=1 Tax=Paenibacillus thailandensis TaxID=393250 RepID=A0ABW5R332_9BACL
MKWLRKFQRFYRYPAELKWMFLEAYCLLGWARILKLLPFAKVAPMLGDKMLETSHQSDPEQDQLVRKVSKAIHAMSKLTPWESQCLVRAIAAMRMLEKRGVSSTLYLGSGRDENGKMIAHAWLRSGNFLVTGNEGLERFVVVGIFGNQASRRAANRTPERGLEG